MTRIENKDSGLYADFNGSYLDIGVIQDSNIDLIRNFKFEDNMKILKAGFSLKGESLVVWLSNEYYVQTIRIFVLDDFFDIKEFEIKIPLNISANLLFDTLIKCGVGFPETKYQEL